MQSTSMAFDVVTEDNVYTCVGHPLKSDIANVVTWMLNEEFTTAYSSKISSFFSQRIHSVLQFYLVLRNSRLTGAKRFSSTRHFN